MRQGRVSGGEFNLKLQLLFFQSAGTLQDLLHFHLSTTLTQTELKYIIQYLRYNIRAVQKRL